MQDMTRRRILGAALGLLVLGGCDPNPNGPTFPKVAEEKDDDAAADGTPGKTGKTGKGRRKAAPVTTINDPAA